MRDTAPPAFKDKIILVHLPTYVVRMDSPLEEKYDAALRKGNPPSDAAVRLSQCRRPPSEVEHRLT